MTRELAGVLVNIVHPLGERASFFVLGGVMVPGIANLRK